MSESDQVNSASGSDGIRQIRDRMHQLHDALDMIEQRVLELEGDLNDLCGKAPGINPQDRSIDAGSDVDKPVDVELSLGRNWLNRIGVVILSLGLGSVIIYLHKDFSPYFKIACGYLIAGIFFYAGVRTQVKGKYVILGRLLSGLAWVAMYISSYTLRNGHLLFLTLCWLFFLVIVHVFAARQGSKLLAWANFANIGVYSILALPLVLKLSHDQQALLVLGAGAVYLICALSMKRVGQNGFYAGDLVAAVLSLMFAVFLLFPRLPALMAWLILFPALLCMAGVFKEKILRYLGLALSLVVAGDLLCLYFSNDLALRSLECALVVAGILTFFGVFYIFKHLRRLNRVPLEFAETLMLFWVGILLFVFAAFQYVPSAWISVSLGAASVVLIWIGIMDGGKAERVGGLALFLLALLRVIFIDSARMDIIYKTVTFVVLGAFLFGVSLLYKRFTADKPAQH